MRITLKLCALFTVLHMLQACGSPLERGIKAYENQRYARAVECFRKAAKQENGDAMAYLGYCYFQGTGLEKNERQAFYWNHKGVQHNSPIAMQNIEYMAEHGSETAKEYKTFVDRINSRLYEGPVRRYTPKDASTYSLPQNRYLATVDEYIKFLQIVGKLNNDFRFKPKGNYCWITSHERNTYYNIFKLANPYSPALAVDLGLSVKWAPYNIGANSPEELGDRFAWGETAPKSSYTILTYKYARGSYESFQYIGNEISGTGYDTATMMWGSRWRMPSASDYQELIDNCDIKWVEDSEPAGISVTGPNGNRIFFPVEDITTTFGSLFNTKYYTSSLKTFGLFNADGSNAYVFKFSEYGVSIGSELRDSGCYIRPVFVEQ